MTAVADKRGEKMRAGRNKKNVLILCIVLTAGLCSIGGTIAYFTSYDRMENVISIGYNSTEIEEEFPQPSPVPIEESPQYHKKVWVSNTAQNDAGALAECYVRVSLGYSHREFAEAVVLKDLDTENWVYKGDGYYYYKRPLKEGEKTTPLFTGFSIDSSKVDINSLDHITEFEIQVYEESVQAEGFDDFEKAWLFYQDSV